MFAKKKRKRKKERKGGCNRQLIALPFTKNSPLFKFKQIHSSQTYLEINLESISQPSSSLDSFFTISPRTDRDSIDTLTQKFFLLQQKIILPSRNILTPVFILATGGYLSVVGGDNFQFTVGFNASRHVPEKKKRFSKTLRKDYITIFKGQGVFVVNFYATFLNP